MDDHQINLPEGKYLIPIIKTQFQPLRMASLGMQGPISNKNNIRIDIEN